MAYYPKKGQKRSKAAKVARAYGNTRSKTVATFDEDAFDITPEEFSRIGQTFHKAWLDFLTMVTDPLRPTPWDYFEMGTIFTSHQRIKTMYKPLHDFMLLILNRNTKGEVDESYQYLQHEGDRMFEFEDDEKARAFYDDCVEMKVKAVLDDVFVLVREFNEYDDESQDNIIKAVDEQDGWDYEDPEDN